VGVPALGDTDVSGMVAHHLSSVIAPLFALLLVGVAFLADRTRRVGAAPISIGSMYALAVLVYGAYPLVIYLALGGVYTPLNDGRLFAEQPAPAGVGRIAWYYAVYLASFCVAYVVVAPRIRKAGPISLDLDSPSLWALFAAFVVLRSTTVVAEALFAANALDYTETYLKYQHLPLIAQQLLGHMEGIASILALAVVAALCREWNRYRWVVLVWLALELSLLLMGLGARTQFVLLCLAALFSYHYLWKPVSTVTLGAAGLVLLVGFVGLGMLRQYGGADLAALGIEVIAGSSEFESLFANAYDVDRLIAFGEIDRASMIGTVYVGDLVNLVPQQLVPFAKVSLPTWYLEAFYPEFLDQGGGLAFGAVAEALIGSGWPDLVWRGAFVGAALGLFDHWVTVTRVNFWRFVFCLWLMTSCYLIFRTTTFTLVAVFVYRFLPALLMVSVLAYLLRAAAVRPAVQPA